MWALNHDIIVALEPSWTRRDRLRNVYRNVVPDTITTSTPSSVISQNAPRPDEPSAPWMILIIPYPNAIAPRNPTTATTIHGSGRSHSRRTRLGVGSRPWASSTSGVTRTSLRTARQSPGRANAVSGAPLRPSPRFRAAGAAPGAADLRAGTGGGGGAPPGGGPGAVRQAGVVVRPGAAVRPAVVVVVRPAAAVVAAAPGSRRPLHLEPDHQVAPPERLHRVDPERGPHGARVHARVVRVARAQVALHGDAVAVVLGHRPHLGRLRLALEAEHVETG